MVKTMEVVEVEGQTNSAVEKLAAHKTETVLISSRKKIETATVLIEGVAITLRRAIKYRSGNIVSTCSIAYASEHQRPEAGKA